MEQSNPYDQAWLVATKPIMPGFIGSRAQLEGYDAELCPTCGHNLKRGLCIQGLCHLREDLRPAARAIIDSLKGAANAATATKRRKYGRRRSK